jgi:hypothetical protein
VAGLPRSGTSWLAKAISLADGVTYYFEPENTDNLDRKYRYRYRDPAVEDAELGRFLEGAFRGRYNGDYQIAEKGLREILLTPLAHTCLVKSVFLTAALDWIGSRFPDVTVVQLVRHPVPQFLSWKARGWRPDRHLDNLLGQTDLMAGPLAEQHDLIAGAKGFWGKSSAFWGAMTLLQTRFHRKGWFLHEHEWYCADPPSRVRWLLGELGLQYNNRIEEFISPDRGIVSGPGYGQRRDPRSELTKWQGRISETELSEVRETLACFGLPFYASSELDGLGCET